MCELGERTWGCFIPKSINAVEISDCILEQLEKIFKGNTSKLIGQTYDGASVTSGRFN